MCRTLESSSTTVALTLMARWCQFLLQCFVLHRASQQVAPPFQVQVQVEAPLQGHLVQVQAEALLQVHLVQVQVGALLQVLPVELVGALLQVGAPLAQQHHLPTDCSWRSSTWMIRPKVWMTWTERIQTSLESALTSTTLHQMNRSKGWIRRSSLARSSRVCC